MRTGLEIGGALGRGQRQREQQDAQAGAFSTGGWSAAAQTAGSQGNFEAAKTFQDTATQQQNAGFTRARETAQVLGRVGASLSGVPMEQRQARVQQMAPMLERMGIGADQLAQADWSDQGLQEMQALSGQLERFSDIRTVPGVGLVGVTATGQTEVLQAEQPQWQTNGDVPYRVVNGVVETGQGRIPHRAPQGAGGSYRPVTPEEAQAYGLQNNGQGYAMSPQGRPVRVGSVAASGFGPDQRARVAITLDPALEASRTLERMDAEAVTRQGTHVSDTPLGQDWLARAAEAVPFDGGTAARTIGGDDYNRYTSASSAFEAAMLPILSGAAVTESEAQRVVRAVLPRQGDSQAVLAEKARRRRQMLNGAALIGGRQLPYPEETVADWAQRYANAVQQTQQDAPAGDRPLSDYSDDELNAMEQQLMQGGQ